MTRAELAEGQTVRIRYADGSFSTYNGLVGTVEGPTDVIPGWFAVSIPCKSETRGDYTVTKIFAPQNLHRASA